MKVNEIWCSICCRYMQETCKLCNHFDEQVHLDQEDKGTGMVTGEPAVAVFCRDPEKQLEEEMAEHARNNLLMECCMNNPELYNKIGNIIYKLYGKPMGAELTMLVTYVCRELKKGR